jgi:endonuclease/exonuclease/phosphatase family metal-dependent hydrolase
MIFRTTLLFSTLCLVFSCRTSQSLPTPDAPAPGLVFYTYNIRFDNPNDGPDRWALRREAVAAELLLHRPAVIGLQEVLLSQLTFLEARMPGYQRYGVGRTDGKNDGEFSPILIDTSVFRLLEGRTFWLSNTPDVPSKGWDAALPRIATQVILQEKATGDSIWVINTHYDHMGSEARLRSSELIVKLLSPVLQRGKPAVIMGDFNATPEEPPIQVMKTHFTEACPVAESANGTFNGFELNRSEYRRIDYIWFSPANWHVKHYEVRRPKVLLRQVSDHFGVLARFIHN